MTKVITYGTYDMLHYGHIRLLERAKALGDYLIVGVTSDDFDKTRGKINVKQSLAERIAAVQATGLADEILIEEYDGQKIDDIRKYDVDIFTVGSDWVGKFDYLNDYCKVVYLDRTEGVSSSDIRSQERQIRIGLVGESEERIFRKYYKECRFVNGATVTGVCTNNPSLLEEINRKVDLVSDNYDDFLESVDAVYILSHPSKHYEQIKKAISCGKHVLCEAPISLSEAQTKELFADAKTHNVLLMEAIKTAYATAYDRVLLLVKSGRIGQVASVDATCTSIQSVSDGEKAKPGAWNSICAWGPTALLPVFQLLGTEVKQTDICSMCVDSEQDKFDVFSRINLLYPNAAASVKVGRGIKSEGELIISGTEGYVYVPAPWWKTDYFEIRYENPADNKRYFYQLNGEGIRNELVAFLDSITSGKNESCIDENVSESIARVIEQFYAGNIHSLNVK